jgi:hypothetical protein
LVSMNNRAYFSCSEKHVILSANAISKLSRNMTYSKDNAKSKLSKNMTYPKDNAISKLGRNIT